MCSAGSDWTCLQPGFPIRKSSDHSLVIDSPRLIADSYVLLRFLVPRHPPCALKNLSHKDARVHCSVLNIRSAPTTPWAPTTLVTAWRFVPHGRPAPQPPQPWGPMASRRSRHHPQPKSRGGEPEPSGPNNVSSTPAPTLRVPSQPKSCAY